MSQSQAPTDDEQPRIVFVQVDSDRRLDLFLVEHLAGYTRSRIQKLIRAGSITVNHRIVTKTGYRLSGGDSLRAVLPVPSAPTLRPEFIPLEILHEDENFLAVNKPSGMVVHPSTGHLSGTLVHAILAHAPDLQPIGGEIRPGIVHRLDKDTSGIILIAKNETTLQNLQSQFKRREVKKTYLGLVEGRLGETKGRISGPIGRSSVDRKKMAVTLERKGRAARTNFTVLERFSEHSYLEIQPETGRTHQIRVHFAGLGHPIAGDRVYGRKRASIPMDRHFLHAAGLGFVSPTSEEAVHLQAPLPPDLASVLDRLRKNSKG